MLLAFGGEKCRRRRRDGRGVHHGARPASVLQMHPVVKVMLDEPAASHLRRREYYRQVFDHKPAWQQW